MCMNLLARLATAKLPHTEADPAAIDRLRVLEAARHIRVLIPPAHADCDHCLRQDAATVFEITPWGWKALRAGAPQEDEQREMAPQRHSPRSARNSRPKTASAMQDLARIAAWLSGTRRRSGE
jgi:hypothetical protein